MSRKKKDLTREVRPDQRFGSDILSKTISAVMRSGKRGLAEKIVYSALDEAAAKTSKEPMEAFEEALANIRPVVEVRSRRVGGATYQVPTEVSGSRAQALALRWLIKSANERSERTAAKRLAGELIDAVNNRGLAVKKREDTHRMADANKAFSHFRW